MRKLVRRRLARRCPDSRLCPAHRLGAEAVLVRVVSLGAKI